MVTGEKVRIYWNLHRDCWSVQKKDRHRSGWRVRDYVESFVLFEPTFHVSAAGRLRANVEQRKNVHAWVEGELVEVGDWHRWADRLTDLQQPVDVRYNPYRHALFHADPDDPFNTSVWGASIVVGDSDSGSPCLRAWGPMFLTSKAARYECIA